MAFIKVYGELIIDSNTAYRKREYALIVGVAYKAYC